MLYELDEGQRQMVLLALAELELERSGWSFAIGEIAEQLHGREMLEDFKDCNRDRVKSSRRSILPHGQDL